MSGPKFRVTACPLLSKKATVPLMVVAVRFINRISVLNPPPSANWEKYNRLPAGGAFGVATGRELYKGSPWELVPDIKFVAANAVDEVSVNVPRNGLEMAPWHSWLANIAKCAVAGTC
jgi:hypothetical protein